MDLATKLAELNLPPAAAEYVAQLQSAARYGEVAVAQLARRETELHAANVKIAALTHEVAHLRRMRYGVKSESDCAGGALAVRTVVCH